MTPKDKNNLIEELKDMSRQLLEARELCNEIYTVIEIRIKLLEYALKENDFEAYNGKYGDTYEDILNHLEKIGRIKE